MNGVYKIWWMDYWQGEELLNLPEVKSIKWYGVCLMTAYCRLEQYWAIREGLA